MGELNRDIIDKSMEPCYGCPYSESCHDDHRDQCILAYGGWKDPHKRAEKNIQDCDLILERIDALDPEKGIGEKRSDELGWGNPNAKG